MELKKDSRWNAFDIVDFKSFKERMLPKNRFTNDVNETIKKSFIIIEKLLYHSYYEYEFYDIAAQKSLLYFEMALKIRFKEVNNVEWNKKKSLKELVDCFDSQHYFEVLNKEYLNWIRKVRNYYAHPDTYSFGGPMTKHNIENSVDLINDLYEDPSLRENRQLKLKDLQNKLDSLTKTGAVFVNGVDKEIISKADLIFIDNKGSNETIYLLFFPLFDTFESHLISSPLHVVECNQIEFIEGRCNIKYDDSEVHLYISSSLNENDKRICDAWFQKFNTDENLKASYSLLLHKKEEIYKTILRNFHHKE